MGSETSPTPHEWPPSFSATFVSNISDPTLGNGTANPDTRWAITETLYYGWAGSRSQRVDHGPGAVECVKFYHTSRGCSLIMGPQGTYRIVEGDPVPCCLDMPSLKAPP